MEFNTDPNFDINDFIHDPLLFTEEGIDRYCPGGFHPVSIGDQFHDGRYTVHHKLGFGESATVWLATDNNNPWLMAGWVALKILAAHIKEPKEIRNLQYLSDKLEDEPRHGIVHLLNNFVIEGPNGTHHCLVLGGIGPSFEFIEQSYIDFNKYHHFLEFGNTEFGNPDYLKLEDYSMNSVSHRLLTAVQHMHGLGLCHGGINGANIIFTGTMPFFVSRKELDEILGSLQVVSLERCDGMPLGKGLPKQIVQSAKWPDFVVDFGTESFCVIGFGQSFLRGEEPDSLEQPVHLRCPETIMGEKLDYRLDLWHTGCFIYQIATLTTLSPGPLDNYKYIKSMIGFVEDLPVEWESRLEELRFISEQNSALGKGPTAATEIGETEALGPAVVVASAKEGSGAEESSTKDGTSSKVPCLKDMAANDDRRSHFLKLLQGLLLFRPSDRLALHAVPAELRPMLSGWLFDFPLLLDAAESEQELDEQTRPAIYKILEVPEQPQPEDPEGALDLPGNHEQQLPAQDETKNLPNRYDDQPQGLSDLSQSTQQAQPGAPTGTSEPLVNREPQQPQVSEVCESTETSQSEAHIGILDMYHRIEYQLTSPRIPTNLEQDQPEVLDVAPDVPDNQGEQQPEVSDIPESSKRSELETTEDAAASSESSQQQEPGSRKRLRSRLEGLLNHGWMPWKRRRNS